MSLRERRFDLAAALRIASHIYLARRTCTLNAAELAMMRQHPEYFAKVRADQHFRIRARILCDEKARARRRIGPLEALLERRLQGTGLGIAQLWEALDHSESETRRVVRDMEDLPPRPSAHLPARA